MIEKKVTDNGITVIFDSIDNISTCSLGVFVRTGSKDELPDEDGISHVLKVQKKEIILKYRKK